MSQQRDALLARLAASLSADRLGEFKTPWGVFPSAAPGSAEEVALVLGAARETGARVRPAGRGSKLAWSKHPERVDLVLTSFGLDGVIAYEPGDGTVTAEAGVSWHALAELVHGGGHHLTPWIPRAATATVGGVVGAGQSGIDRLRYGPLRHHVLGLGVVLADGRRVKCGGRLVKNVTGFELQRLLTGSRGTLGFVTEVSLRLFPAGERLTVASSPEVAPPDALAVAERLADALFQPLALVVEIDGGVARTHVVLAGRGGTLDAERLVVRRLLGAAAAVHDDGAALPLVERLADLAAPAAPHVVIGARPSALPAALDALLGEAADVAALVQPRLGLTTIACADAARGIALRERARRLPVTLEGRGIDVAPLGRSDAEAAWTQRLRRSQDPGGVFA